MWSNEEEGEECRLRIHLPADVASVNGIRVEVEDVAPPTRLPQEQLLKTSVCRAYAVSLSRILIVGFSP